MKSRQMTEREGGTSRERVYALWIFVFGAVVAGSYVVARSFSLIIGNSFANINGSSLTDPKSYPSLWTGLAVVSLTSIALIAIIVRERHKNQPYAREVVCAVLSVLLAVLGWAYLAVT